MELEQLKPLVTAWMDANRLAQQLPDTSCYDIAKQVGAEYGSEAWHWAVQGAAQYKFNGATI